MELTWLYNEEIVWLGEHELLHRPSVSEDTSFPRCTEIPSSVVLPTKPRCKDTVHKHVRNGVNNCLSAFPEAFIYRPYFHPPWHFLVFGRVTPRIIAA